MATAEEKHNVRLSKALSWLLRHHLDLVSEITKQRIGKVIHFIIAHKPKKILTKLCETLFIFKQHSTELVSL